MLPPGPRTPALWQTFRFSTSPREYSLGVQAQYGLVTRFRGLNGDGIAIADPEIARELFAADSDNFTTPSVLSDMFGAFSVLATSGALHKRQRRLLNPRFHGARVRAFLETMQRVVHEHLDGLRKAASEGRVVVMSQLAQALTLDLIMETVFGGSIGLERPKARAILQDLLRAISSIFVFARALRSPLFPPWRRFQQRRAVFDAWVDGMIARRRAQGRLGEDILGLLLEARYDDGSAMADAEIRDLVMTLLLAGHETTAIALAWGVYWLLREPAALARLRDDIDALGPEPSADALSRLPYMQAVISETLRIEPIVTDIGRICRVPLRLGPYTLPAGQVAVINVSAILANETLFPDPLRFRPERFLDTSFSAWQFMPFGGGHRRFLGAAFAEAELSVALGAIAGEWELALADGPPERAARRNITMGPRHGVRVRVVGARAPRVIARAS
jgi:cytochrome P450